MDLIINDPYAVTLLGLIALVFAVLAVSMLILIVSDRRKIENLMTLNAKYDLEQNTIVAEQQKECELVIKARYESECV